MYIIYYQYTSILLAALISSLTHQVREFSVLVICDTGSCGGYRRFHMDDDPVGRHSWVTVRCRST